MVFSSKNEKAGERSLAGWCAEKAIESKSYDVQNILVKSMS